MNIEAPVPFPSGGRLTEQVAFDRKELSLILRLYGQMVALGEWRDYGISHGRDIAVFAVFRRTAEVPLYRIEKRPKLRNAQGMYAVATENGHILRRGPDLEAVLKVLQRKLIRPVE